MNTTNTTNTTNMNTNTMDSDNKLKGIDTTTFGYNYGIMLTLYNQYKTQINNGLNKMINRIVNLIIANNPTVTTNDARIGIINDILFKDSLVGQGQILPQIYIKNKLKNMETIEELKETFIPSLNFREKMSIVRNFASKDNCLMYTILIEYNKSKNNNLLNTAFEKKYPMLNLDYLNESVTMIENIIGFDISETNKCYDDINGTSSTNCSATRQQPNKSFYKMMQQNYIENPTKSPITLCWLWHPLVYGVPYQNVVKLPADNAVKKMMPFYEKNDKPQFEKCMNDTFNNYPVFPPLSKREQTYMKNKGAGPNVDGLYKRPPWTPPYCYYKKPTPTFTTNMLKRYNKFSVSNLSGHTMLFIIVAKYFKDINLNMIVLASMLFMVPYNHSIHEIFQAAKMLGVNTGYSIKKTDLENMNYFLTDVMKMEPIESVKVIANVNKYTPVSNKRNSKQTQLTNVKTLGNIDGSTKGGPTKGGPTKGGPTKGGTRQSKRRKTNSIHKNKRTRKKRNGFKKRSKKSKSKTKKK